MTRIELVLVHQDGVISRSQVVDLGGTDNDIERLVRRRIWSRVHPGVYVDHTGKVTLSQREWAAVLFAAPAALGGWSALRRHGVRTGREDAAAMPEIEIVIDHARRVSAPEGVRVVRVRDFEKRVLAHLSPPRLRVEDATLDLAAAADELHAVAVVADACRSRRTTASRLLHDLESRARMRHRSLLLRILRDVAMGTHSVLEWLYLMRVDRPHGLPVARRQRVVRAGRAVAYPDIEYVECATIVELDGRLGHDLALDRWDDLTRDVDAAASGLLTMRLGWRQVLEPCRAAAAISQVLVARGAPVVAKRCSATCPVEDRVNLPA